MNPTYNRISSTKFELSWHEWIGKIKIMNTRTIEDNFEYQIERVLKCIRE